MRAFLGNVASLRLKSFKLGHFRFQFDVFFELIDDAPGFGKILAGNARDNRQALGSKDHERHNTDDDDFGKT